VQFFGGVDAPGLVLVAIPMVVYGSFLPRRDAWLLTAAATAALAGVLFGQRGGWLPHVCPPVPGMECHRTADAVLMMRLVTTAGLMGLATHLTTFIGGHLRRQEADARLLAEERGRLAEARKHFVSLASHEFRTPIAIIRMASDALRRYWTRMDEPQRQERFDRIATATRHMGTLLDGVLTLGQLDGGTERRQRRRLDVVALCNAIASELQPSCTDGRTLSVASDAAVLEAVVDAHLLRTIVRQLTENGLKFSPPGGRVTIEIEGVRTGVALRVRDRGCGIAGEEQERIFEAFHRGGNAGATPGVGLGLAIVRKAAELHGATITVASRPGDGAVFEVELRHAS
jgi:signal transduction histidine kinase